MDRRRRLLDWEWVMDHLDEGWANTLEHLRLTVIAVVVVLVPIPGLGSPAAAEIALVGYTLLILVRNIVAGIDGVPAAVRDAADGRGLSRGRRLGTVQLPLAL